MKKYFVDADGRIQGVCVADEPVNPLGWQIVDLEELSGDCRDYVYASGVVTLSPAVLPLDQQIKAYTVAVQRFLDEAAKAKGYDSIVSACSYAGYENVFKDEAISFGVWRSAVWAYCYAELAKVESGIRAIPTVAEILAELPARVLP